MRIWTNGEDPLRGKGLDRPVSGKGRQQSRELRRQNPERTRAQRDSRGIADALIGDEEEETVFTTDNRLATFAKARQRQRPTDRAAEYVVEALVRFELSASLLNIVKTVQVLVVLVEPKRAAVVLVRAALGHDVDHRALVATILRREVVGDDLVFLNLILIIDEHGGSGDAQVIIIRAIDLKVIRAPAVAVNRQSGAVRVRAAAIIGDDTRSEERQRIETAARAVRGQLRNPAGVDRRRNLRLISLDDLFRVGRNRYGFRHVARLEYYCNGVDDTYFDLHASADGTFEVRCFDGHGVFAGLEGRSVKSAIASRRAGVQTTGGLILYGHRSAGNHATVGIGNCASERASGGLGHHSNS